MNALRHHILDPLRSGRMVRDLGSVVAGLVLGPAWLVLLVTGWSLGLGLLITLIGIPLLVGLLYLVQAAAGVERGLLRFADPAGPRPAPPREAVWRGSLWTSLHRGLADSDTWRAHLLLVARMAVGFPLAVALLAVIGMGGQLLALPAYYRYAPLELGIWTVDTWHEALALAPIGLLLLVAAVPLSHQAARAWGALVRAILTVEDGRRTRPQSGGGAGGPRRAPHIAPLTWLTIHLGAWALVNLILVITWVATTPGGYFWPVWPLISTGALLGQHAVLLLAPRVVANGDRRRVALVRHAGCTLVVSGFMAAIWLAATPGGYFWPIWVAGALLVPLGLHAGYDALGFSTRDRLTERIDILTTTRAGAVDAQAAELRRIERDLHDGAQARLVSLALDLGLARQRLADQPPELRTLLDGAHEQAKTAIVELRDLARGIHPAVLSDRGLEAAVRSLVGAVPLPTSLKVDLPRRPEPALEAAAYFVVAEAVANATRHADASELAVEVVGDQRTLRVRVRDDGRGGADLEGGGLTGLRRRVEAHDGILAVISPPSGGTTIEAVIPCGS